MSNVRLESAEYLDTIEGPLAGRVRVLYVTYVDTMPEALELTRNVTAVARLGVTANLHVEGVSDTTLEEHRQNCQLYIDEDEHAMTNGRLEYLIACAERRGYEKGLAEERRRTARAGGEGRKIIKRKRKR